MLLISKSELCLTSYGIIKFMHRAIHKFVILPCLDYAWQMSRRVFHSAVRVAVWALKCHVNKEALFYQLFDKFVVSCPGSLAGGQGRNFLKINNMLSQASRVRILVQKNTIMNKKNSYEQSTEVASGLERQWRNVLKLCYKKVMCPDFSRKRRPYSTCNGLYREALVQGG